jgi:formylglycine-generating enzyme required for sulfatase activity
LVEASLLREAQTGNVAATRSLFDTYASLVSALPDGGTRLSRIETTISARLLLHGDRSSSSNLRQAAVAWAMAAEFDPRSEAASKLRNLLLPPGDAEPGQVWRSPVDGAELVFHPAMAIRLGCTEADGACRDNEVYFVYAEVGPRWFDSHEVSNRQYRLCVDAGACSPPEGATAFDDPNRADHPVVGVSWRQARAYARWAGRRLPSEAEWERAARGEVNTARFPWGSGRRRELANIWHDVRDTTTGGTAAGGSYPSSGYGMSDLAGNVWEWCQDRYQPRFSDHPADGGAVRTGWGRVVRGGSWRRAIDMARVSVRSWFDVGYHGDDLGFRCVADHDRQVSVDELVRLAQRAFPVAGDGMRGLDQAQLETEDRRFLERRAITLYVIEGRLEEALAPAAARLDSEARDPVALGVFDRFEAELLGEVAGGELTELERGLRSYRRVAAVNSGLTARIERFERRVLDALRRAVGDLERRGDREAAHQAARIALALAPADQRLDEVADRLRRKAGSTRVWHGDGKGMAWIEPGDFRLGASPGDHVANLNELPAFEVAVEGFWMDRTEVTNDEYRGCVEAQACTPPHRTEFFDNPNMGNHPVLWVDWFQARTYAAWAGKRLPSEAEWEYAARAGAGTAYPWGDPWRQGLANSLGLGDGDQWGGTAPVASFEANRWGVYDLIGNAAEWVDDVYNETFHGSPRDGRPRYQETGPAAERRRVVRGAGYDEPPGRQRVSRRNGRRPDNDHRMVGFRCVADE